MFIAGEMRKGAEGDCISPKIEVSNWEEAQKYRFCQEIQGSMNENYPNPVHSEFSFQGAKQRPASQFLPDWSICHGAHYQLPLTKLKYVLLIQLSWYDTFNMGQGWYCTFNMIQLIRTPPTIWDTADMEPQYDSTQLIQTTPIILDTADMGPTIWDRNEELFAS